GPRVRHCRCSPPPMGSDSTAGLLVVVEDDADIRETLAMVLAAEGYEVATAAHGAEALAWLRASSRRPDAILLDLMMPVMDGWEFRKAQLADGALADIPVVIVSAHEVRPDSNLAAAAVLSKPVLLETMLGVLARVCARSSAVA